MFKYKKIIIIFSLILSVLFVNITPVLCSTIQLNFSDSELLRTVENPEVILINNKTSENITVTYYNYNNGYYVFASSSNFSVGASFTIKFLDNNIVLYENTNFIISNSNNYNFTGAKYPEETTETTETTENTEENNNNIVIDNTEVLVELKEIKTYLIMFFGLFLFYFGYKLVKEISNKTKGDY